MVKKSETKAKTKAKDENSTFIVNSQLQLFFMNQRHKSTVLDSTIEMMLNYYNEEKISEAMTLLHNKITPEKGSLKEKVRERQEKH